MNARDSFDLRFTVPGTIAVASLAGLLFNWRWTCNSIGNLIPSLQGSSLDRLAGTAAIAAGGIVVIGYLVSTIGAIVISVFVAHAHSSFDRYRAALRLPRPCASGPRKQDITQLNGTRG